MVLPTDPVAAPSERPRPPKGTATNPALCKQCNASLHVDDSFLKPLLKTSSNGEPYLGGIDHGRAIFVPGPHSVFGGIDYARRDQIPTLPDLSLAAESGCVFCAAVRAGLQNEYQRSPWWKPHPEPLTLRIQYSWMFSRSGINLDAVVVSVLHPELRGWKDQVLRFWAYAAGGTSIHHAVYH